MNPFLSIVIVNFNYGRFLSEAIESLLSQSYQDYELIICDGGSTDNFVEVIKKYAVGLPLRIKRVLGDRCRVDDVSSRSNIQVIKQSNKSLISYWDSEYDKGQSHAFNMCFARAHGRFLTWLNADDAISFGTVEKLKIAAEKYPEYECLVGECFWFDPEMRIINCGRDRSFSEIRYHEGNVSVSGTLLLSVNRFLDSVGRHIERPHYCHGRCSLRLLGCREEKNHRVEGLKNG